MKKILTVFLFLCAFPCFGQSGNTFPSGLGIELGFGSGELLWGLRDGDGDRSVFKLSLSSHLYYKFPITKSLKLKPFAGYIRFGGLSEEQENGYKDEYYFDAVEFGALVLLEEPDLPINFGLGLKAKSYFNAVGRFYGKFENQGNEKRIWTEEDVTDLFKNISYNIGASVGTSFSNFFVSMEYWVGLNDFKNDDLFDGSDTKIKENHYRLFFGYQL